MNMPRGNPKALSLGPGILLINTIGGIEPTDLDTAWHASWVPLGYTHDGSQFSSSTASAPVEVAEEVDQLDDIMTGREMKVGFQLAEITADNLKRAHNGGTITLLGDAPDQFHKFEPPALGDETACMLGWQAEDGEERYVWRQCKQRGEIQIGRKKGADKAGIPTEFKVFKPDSGEAPWFALTRRGLVVG